MGMNDDKREEEKISNKFEHQVNPIFMKQVVNEVWI